VAGRDAMRAGSLVGRDAELAMIHAFLFDADWRGGALLLVGDAGVGRTALLDAAVAGARSVSARHAICSTNIRTSMRCTWRAMTSSRQWP
jgi:hypothetical protein